MKRICCPLPAMCSAFDCDRPSRTEPIQLPVIPLLDEGSQHYLCRRSAKPPVATGIARATCADSEQYLRRSTFPQWSGFLTSPRWAHPGLQLRFRVRTSKGKYALVSGELHKLEDGVSDHEPFEPVLAATHHARILPSGYRYTSWRERNQKYSERSAPGGRKVDGTKSGPPAHRHAPGSEILAPDARPGWRIITVVRPSAGY